MTIAEARRKMGLAGAALAMFVVCGIPANAASHASVDAQRQSSLARTIVRLSLEYHYPAVKIDADFSRRVISRYLEILDPGHFYFTQQDAKAIHSAFDSRLAKDLKTGNLTPAHAIHKFFEQRKKQLFSFALQLLAQKPDLDSNTRYRIDRKDVPPPKDNAALEQLWENRIENEILDRLLRGEHLEDALSVLRTRYRNPDPGNDEDAFGQYINAFMTALDPHSRYINAEETDGRVGIMDNPQGIAGTRLVNRNGYVTVVRLPVPDNTPAPARLINGERLLAIRKKPQAKTIPLSGWNLGKAISIIRESVGTRARLLVQLQGPAGLQRTKWVRLPARSTQFRARRAEAYIDLAREGTSQYKIGVIRIPSFYRGVESATGDHGSRGAASDVVYLIQLLKRKGVSALLLDMRGNPGGSVRQALAMTGLFIPVDKPVVKILTRFGTNRHSPMNGNDGIAWRGPLGILVNRGSASATEIFCGALKDYHRAIILGTRTWGKGTIQTFIPLAKHTDANSPGKLKLTTGEFFRPDGVSPQIRGILPDIILPSASDAFIGGESAYPDALPAVTTAPLRYKPLDSSDHAQLPKLENYFRNELEKGKALKLYRREVNLLEKSDNPRVSLDLRDRRHSIATHDARWTKLEKDWRSMLGDSLSEGSGQSRRETFPIPDVPLDLAIRIMGKFADLSPSVGLKMNFHIEELKTYRCWYPSWEQLSLCIHDSQQIFYAPGTHSSSKPGMAAPPLSQDGGL